MKLSKAYILYIDLTIYLTSNETNNFDNLEQMITKFQGIIYHKVIIKEYTMHLTLNI